MGHVSCAMPGCTCQVAKRGYCQGHYKQALNSGILPRIVLRTAEERFWAKVNKDGPIPNGRPDLGPCWLWTGAKDQRGYGHLTSNGRTLQAHRHGYELTVGPIPAKLVMDHLCRVVACVRPSHLEPVTHATNLARGIGPIVTALRAAAITHCPSGHPYSFENTYVNPAGSRECRACSRAATARWRARRRAMGG